jgi:phenylpyruvate tautomerase PptA (4-oxalocrotonate tautomerase family)
MPLARIDLIKGKSAEYRQAVGDVVYTAMVEILKAPKNDRFQVIAEHDESNFIYDPTFFVGTGREDWSFGNGEASLVKS